LRNHGIARNWKIKFNETGKIPAFYNSLPELNHNEMTGFDVADASRALSEHFYFLILKDPEDNPRIHKRMEILEKLYADRGLSVETITLEGDAAFYKAAVALMIADWAAFYTAEGYGLESEQVPMVEEFKKLIK
jgi:glucose/mannose-6-phosphate isomerase